MKKNIKQKKNDKELEKFPVKEFTVVISVITGAFLLVYGLTVGANKLGWFDPHYIKPDIETPVISYENIEAGTILNREENDYYVVLADMSNNSKYITEVINEYNKKENKIKLYKVDLSEGLNRSIVSDTSNLIVSNLADLKVSDTSLLRVTNHKIVNAYSGVDNIENILK